MEIKYIFIYIYYFIIKMLTLILKYPNPPLFCPIVEIISQFFAYSSHAKPLNSFSNFKLFSNFSVWQIS